MRLRHRLRLIAQLLDASRQDQSATPHRDGLQRTVSDKLVNRRATNAQRRRCAAYGYRLLHRFSPSARFAIRWRSIGPYAAAAGAP